MLNKFLKIPGYLDHCISISTEIYKKSQLLHFLQWKEEWEEWEEMYHNENITFAI